MQTVSLSFSDWFLNLQTLTCCVAVLVMLSNVIDRLDRIEIQLSVCGKEGP